jgi:signal transduction histidine kinase
MGQRRRIKQKLLNLGDNAVKYTGPAGRIQLRLRADAHEAVLTVSDTGIGIASEDLPRVFDRFYRVPGSDARSRGTGLGLAIARRIVEGHGGSITVESPRGRGLDVHRATPTCSLTFRSPREISRCQMRVFGAITRNIRHKSAACALLRTA